jgi:putative lipoprotein
LNKHRRLSELRAEFGRSRFLAMPIAGTLLLSVGCAARPTGNDTASKDQQAVVRGTVAYRERITLPPDAVVEVWLRDVTPGIIVAQVLLGEATVRSEGRQVPIPFELRYDASRIEREHDYAVQATIQSGGRALFESPTDQRVITKGNPTEVTLWLVRAGADLPDLQGTAWRLESLGGTAALEGAEATLEFPEAGKIAGRGSCNRFFGKVEISGASIKLGPLGSTQMGCAEAVMDQEAQYFRALGGAERYAVEETKLLIYCKGLEKPLRFSEK